MDGSMFLVLAGFLATWMTGVMHTASRMYRKWQLSTRPAMGLT